MNWRFWSAPMPASSAGMSAPPAAERRPSSTRALSFSVCSRPTSHSARVRHRLVVEIDRILGREHEAETEGAPLLEDRQDRLLRRRHGRRRDVAGHLVHVGEGPEVGGAGLTAHPRDELPEDEGGDEHPLLVREVGQIDDRGAWLALRGEQERLRIERNAFAPGGKRRRGDQGVQLQSELGPVLRREEGVDLEDAELSEWWGLDLADERAEIEVAPGTPCVLQQVREEDVLTARERVGGDPDEAEEARDGAFDLVPQRFGLGLPGRRRCAERADHVQRHSGRRARRVDRHVGCFLQLPDSIRADSLGGQAVAPARRGLLGELLDCGAGGLGVGRVHPRQEACRREVGEREGKVPHVALRIDDQGRNAREEGLLEEDDGQSGLARARHADDDAVGGQVARSDHEIVRPGCAGRRIDDLAEVEGTAIRHDCRV